MLEGEPQNCWELKKVEKIYIVIGHITHLLQMLIEGKVSWIFSAVLILELMKLVYIVPNDTN